MERLIFRRLIDWKSDKRRKPSILYNSLIIIFGTKYTKAELTQMQQSLISYEDIFDSGLFDEVKKFKLEV